MSIIRSSVSILLLKLELSWKTHCEKSVRIRENTAQKKRRIWTLFTQWRFAPLTECCIFWQCILCCSMNCATCLEVSFFIIYSPLDNCCVMNYVFERPICIAKKPLWRSSWKIFKSCFYMVCIIGKLLSIFPTTIGDFFSKNYHSVRCWLVTEFLFQEWILGLWKTKCKMTLSTSFCNGLQAMFGFSLLFKILPFQSLTGNAAAFLSPGSYSLFYKNQKNRTLRLLLLKFSWFLGCIVLNLFLFFPISKKSSIMQEQFIIPEIGVMIQQKVRKKKDLF